VGTSESKTEYKIIFDPKAIENLAELDFSIRERVSQKIDWLGNNADVIFHHQLSSSPDELKGLCRVRLGDWRILYWVYYKRKEIKIYGIEHRSKVYKKMRGNLL